MIPRLDTMASPSTSFKGSVSEAGTGSMRSPLSSFTRSSWISPSKMPSPVSSRLTLEFETAFSMEAEDPIRLSSADILPYLSQPSRSCSSSSDFDTHSEVESRATSFCDTNDSNRITLGSLIGLPMDSFRHNFTESFRFLADRRDDTGIQRSTTDSAVSPRRSRTCSLLFDLLNCLQRSRGDCAHFKAPVARPNLSNLTSFTITEVAQGEERGSEGDVGPTVFENSLFVDRDTLGSRIYEFNPLYVFDATAVDAAEVREESASLRRDRSQESAAPTPTAQEHVWRKVQVTRTSSHVHAKPQIAKHLSHQAPAVAHANRCCQLPTGSSRTSIEDGNDRMTDRSVTGFDLRATA